MPVNKIYIPTFISSVTYAPARVLPHIYFYNGLKVCEPYFIQGYSNGNTGSVVSNQQTAFPYFDNYEGQDPLSGSRSLLFFNEPAVYGTTPTGSLYTEYWANYVNLLYNPRTRLVNCEAIIPLADYFKMELNDIVEWRGNYYHLRAINDYNLSNGECKLQLLGPILGDILPDIIPAIACDFDYTITQILTPTTTTTTTTAAPTTTTTVAPTTTTTGGPTTTTISPTTSTTTVSYYLYGNCGYGDTVGNACTDAVINARNLYSNCNSISFGTGCVVYADIIGPAPLTGNSYVFINGAVYDINPANGVIIGLSSIQC